jgi:hypothetical protein
MGAKIALTGLILLGAALIVGLVAGETQDNRVERFAIVLSLFGFLGLVSGGIFHVWAG